MNHVFIATPGPERLPGWTNRCDICGRGYSEGPHNTSDEEGIDALVKVLE